MQATATVEQCNIWDDPDTVLGCHFKNIFTIYRPPSSAKTPRPLADFYIELEQLLTDVSLCVTQTFIVGDFNIKYDDECEARPLIQLLESFNLLHVKDPTHTAGHILDFVISHKDYSFTSPVVVQPMSISDHHLPRNRHKSLSATIDHSTPMFSTLTYAPPVWHCRLQLQLQMVNELVGAYTLSVKCVLDKHAPERLTTVRRDKPNPWYNGDIDDARRRRRKAESVWRGTKLEVHRQIFVAARDECNDIITQAKTTFYRDKLQYADNKSIFQTVSSLTGKPANSYPMIMTRSVSVLTHFQHTSVTRLLKCVPNYMVPTTSAIRHCVKHVGFSHQSSHSTPHV